MRFKEALKWLRLLWMLPAISVAATITSPAFPGVVCETIQVPMRDGTLLATDKYSPDRAGKYPVILLRNPYGRAIGGGCFGGLGASIAAFAQHGYIGLAQEVRGTYRSQGVFHAMVQEARDGYDAIEWAGTQSWSTGKVGTTSGSYLGLTQWQPAIHKPPHLAAISPQITGSDYHDNWSYVNGVFDLWLNMSWPAAEFVGDQMTRGLQAQGVVQSQIDQLVANFNDTVNANLPTKWVWTLPLTGFDQFTTFAPYFYDWLDHPTYDEFWAKMDVETHWQDVQVPALINSAWYDLFQVGAFRNFAGMRSEGGTKTARKGTKILVGPYGHAGDSGTPTFGADPVGALLSVDVQLRFFDHYLKGEDNGYEDDPAVQLYVLVPPDTGNTGTGFMVSGDSYPLPGTWVKSLFLSSGGQANSSKGDGQLVGDAPRHRGDGSRQDQYDYDPAHPVPTVGGNMCCNGVLLAAGARDQTQVELRDDVIVYTSAPLEHDLAVIGPVEMTLWAKSTARDTDFTAKLVDVHLDGASHNVLDRIVRASLRRGSKLPPSQIQPGEEYEYCLLLGNAGTIFRKGHRIRLEISSSSFPHFDRNLNTGKTSEWTAEMQVAHQTILHDARHPSRIELPIAPNVALPR
jgi:putative CocE/NonD family hydrolase